MADDKAKRERTMSYEAHEEGGNVTGVTVRAGDKSGNFAFSGFSQEIILRLAVKGVSLVGKEAAKDETSEEAKLNAVLAQLRRIAETGILSEPRGSIEAEAIARAFNKDVEAVRVQVAKMGEEAYKKVMANANVRAALAAIRAERAASRAKADTATDDEALAALGI